MKNLEKLKWRVSAWNRKRKVKYIVDHIEKNETIIEGVDTSSIL